MNGNVREGKTIMEAFGRQGMQLVEDDSINNGVDYSQKLQTQPGLAKSWKSKLSIKFSS